MFVPFRFDSTLKIDVFRREKEEGAKKDNEDEENEDVIKRGFVPIGQAVKNAEVRDASAEA